MIAVGMISCGVFSSSPTPQIATSTSPSDETSITSNNTTTPAPSPTATLTVLDLEILEWFEYLSPRRAEPSNTDVTIQVLVHNPNDFPVHVNTSDLEFQLLNTAGEIVYTVPSAYFSLWEGTWMLAGDSTGFQICACFQTGGLETQEWESIELFAPIEPATDVAYTTKIEATLGEPINLAESHLGSGTGIPMMMKNISDQTLESIPMRVIARDSSGQFIGMAGFGNSVVSFTENISILPGDSLDGIIESEIDYFDGPLTYEITAIGIIAQTTPEAVLPVGTPLAEWQGIPIMPSAISGEISMDVYQFTVQATVDEVVNYYQTELPKIGFNFQTMEEGGGYTSLYFANSTTSIVLFVAPLGGITGVVITINK